MDISTILFITSLDTRTFAEPSDEDRGRLLPVLPDGDSAHLLAPPSEALVEVDIGVPIGEALMEEDAGVPLGKEGVPHASAMVSGTYG